MESPTPEEKADDNKELNKSAPKKKPPASKRKALTLKEKADIIEEFDKNPFLSKVALARKFNLSRTTLHSIVAKREAIAESMMKYGSFSSMRKKSRTSPFQEIEGKLLMWLEYARSLHLPVNGFLLRQQAIIIAKDLGFAQFTASNGWIERFKSRHGIFWKASKAPLPASKKDDIPLEPTVVIKEEPIEYEPDPADDECADAKDEFILPHEENELTSRDSPLHSVTEPSQQPSFPVPCMESETIEQPVVPTTSILGEQLRRKRKANPSKLSKPNQKVARSAALENSYVYDMSSSPLDNVDESSNPASLNDSRVNDHRHSSVDQFDVFGEYIAAKLRSLDRLSRVFAQKAIGDIIFEAEMGKFRGDEAPMTPSPTPSSSHM